MCFIPVELIIVLTRCVLPTPGGPISNTPLGRSQFILSYIELYLI